MSHMRLRAGLVAGLSAALVAFAATPARAAMKAAVASTPDCVIGQDSTLLALFASGQSFPDFLAAAKARREGWISIADGARVNDALVARAKAVGGTWHLLVVAIDACGDSMNNVPYLAKLSELVPGLDLRIVLPLNGRAVQDSHRSLDGRTATPTFVLLDDKGNDVGCIVELPRDIRDWAHGVRSTVSSDSLHAGIRTFYAANRGVAITTEAVELLEAAKAGSPRCASGTRP
ncbi:thioredoxin family protein [Gemmatimonas sp.]|uniref:thioredoxin family protein n=1 Tax=Gemmatimonas sp. TaxID=1962908 RepID=UPI003983B7CE